MLKATMTVSGLTLVSRILGFIRDIVLARIFGASATTDAFLVAFRIPNLLRRVFAEGSFSLAFVPVLTDYKEKDDRDSLKQFVDRVAGTLGGILLVVVAIGVFLFPFIAGLLSKLLPQSHVDLLLTGKLLQITFPYILFISLVAFSGSILNCYQRFAIPALTPVLLNISLITAAICFSTQFQVPIEALAWGVLIAGIFQLAMQFIGLIKIGLVPMPKWGWQHVGVKKIMKLMVPTLIGSSVAQINILIDTSIAYLLAAGSVTWLYYADRLLEFPLGVFGIALSTVILPRLSMQISQNNEAQFSQDLDRALRLVILIGAPAAIGLIILAKPIMITLFNYESFQLLDAEMAAIALIAYAVGLPLFMMVKVLSPGFYARQDTKTPMRIAIIALLSNVVLNFLFIGLIKFYFDGYAMHAGLALASSISAVINVWLLYSNLKKKGFFQPQQGWLNFLSKIFLASVVMIIINWFISALWSNYEVLDFLHRGLQLSMEIMILGGSYLLTLYAMGVRISMFKTIHLTTGKK